MAFLAWSDKFSVKVKEIDDQHRRLVEMINTLHDAMLAHKGKEIQRDIIDGMVNYAQSHFGTEEKYMRQFTFPGYQVHKAEHDTFAQKALQLQERFDQKGFILTLEIMEFLKSWLRDHILGTDMKYSDHFNQNGLH